MVYSQVQYVRFNTFGNTARKLDQAPAVPKKAVLPKPRSKHKSKVIYIDPVAFLIIKDGITRVMPVSVAPTSTVDRIVEMIPDVMDKVEKYFDKKEAKETVLYGYTTIDSNK